MNRSPPEALSKAVLAEVPGQVTAYFKYHNIVPQQRQITPDAAVKRQAPPPPM